MPHRVSFWKQVLGSLAILALAAGVWSERERLASMLGWSAPAAEPRAGRSATGVPVIVAEVATAPDDLAFQAVGTGRALRSVMLRMETEGKVVETGLAPGADFRIGDVLLRLDSRDARLALELARTRLAESERVRDRYSRLQDTGAATASRLDEVVTAAEIAMIELERAEEALAKRTLLAPFDGVSGIPAVEVGDWIDSDVEIATFDDRSALLVQFDLPEALLARVRSGLAVQVSTPAYPGRSFEGEISAIDSRIDVGSRTAAVRVTVPNGEDLLRPGASFRVNLALPGRDYPIVPELSVQFTRGALHVWRVRDDKAERIPVTLVRRRSGRVLVDGALAEGDLVVVEGTQRLSPGKAVSVVGPPAREIGS